MVPCARPPHLQHEGHVVRENESRTAGSACPAEPIVHEVCYLEADRSTDARRYPIILPKGSLISGSATGMSPGATASAAAIMSCESSTDAPSRRASTVTRPCPSEA